jgi:hypothetical protein
MGQELMSADTLTWGTTVGIATGVPFGLLAVAGTQHLVGDHPRRALGAVELTGAGLGAAALLAPVLLEEAAPFFAVLAVAFLVRLTTLWHTDRQRSCGCTPFATSVTRLSFVPAGTLFAAALVGAAAANTGVSDGAGLERALLFVVSGLLGWALLLWPPAAER